LTELHIHRNAKIVEIPDSITSLTELTVLDVAECQIEALPFHIGDLQNLKRIDAKKNKIGTFGVPESICNLTNLVQLNLSYCFLTRMNCLTSLRDEVFNLSQLVELDVSHNGLSSIPEELGKLTHLSKLYVQNNKLESIPDSIG
jgi:internalin A